LGTVLRLSWGFLIVLMILNKEELRFAWIGLMSIASVTTSAVVVSFLDWIDMRSQGPDLLILTANSMMTSLSGANFGQQLLPRLLPTKMLLY
jgi:uncharacterized membrane protein YfcA